MTIKTCKTAVRASTLLAAIALSGGAFADGGISESFEGKTVGETLTTSTISGLTGNGTYASGGAETAPAAGFPIPDASGHATALEIAGTVTYTEGGSPATKASQVDFMFKVEPTDELEDPTGSDIRVALAVGTNAANTTTAPIKLWCKTASEGAAAWVDLASAVTTGSWMRATLVLDYDNSKCSVSLNGDPVLNGTDKWFYFANNGGSYVASITMVGSTMVDDLVVTHTALNSYTPTGGDATITPAGTSVAVDYAYINKYGVTTNQVVTDAVVNETSGMKVSEKFVAGLDPTSDTKFELLTMTPVSETSATVTFPGNKTSGYTVSVSENANGSSPISTVTTGFGDAGTTAANEQINSATVTLPADKPLLYINVKAN